MNRYKVGLINDQKCSCWHMPKDPLLPDCKLSLTPANLLPLMFTLVFSVFAYCHCCWACDTFISTALAYNLITQMPRKWQEIPIRKHYSEDLKRRVISQAVTLAKKSTEIAINLGMPVHVVQWVKLTWMEIGHVCHTWRFLGRHPLLSPNGVVVSIPIVTSR